MSTALAPLGVPLISPTLPVFRDQFLLTDAQASLLVSGYFVVGVVLSPFIGILTDRLGRRRMLVAGLSIFGAFGGAIALAPSFEIVLALRVVQGTGAAAIFITTVTIVSETFEGPQRNSVLGVNVAVLSATAALFPVLGGALVAISWNAPFVAYLAALPVAAFASVALGNPSPVRAERPDRPGPIGGGSVGYLRVAASVVTRPAILGLFGVTFLTECLAFGVVFTAVPFLLGRVLTPLEVGGVLLAAEGTSTLAAASSGRLAGVLSNERIVSLGFACYGVGFLGTWAAPDPLLTTLALVVVGAGIGVLLPAVDAALSERVPERYRAGAFSLRNSTTFLGRATGPVLFAGLAITAGYGYDPLLLAAGLVSLATAVVVPLLAD